MKVLVVLAALCALACGSRVRLPAPRLDGRIVGGRDTNIEELPYQLSVQWKSSHICGASIISANWALTAAHCVAGAVASPSSIISFRAGTSIRGSKGSVHDAKRIILHPNYNTMYHDYDYALVEVSIPFPVGSAGVQAIGLADSEPAAEAVATVSGWGALKTGGEYPYQLQSANLNIVARNKCEQAYQGKDITERMICAKGYEKGSCRQDGGGPLASEGVLVGIVSWSIGCARLKYPGVYANVADQRDWIRQASGV